MLVAVSTARSYAGATASDDALITILRDGVVTWLQGWIPRYLGTVDELEEILDGPTPQEPMLTSDGVRDPLHYQKIRLNEEITPAALVAIQFRSTFSGDWYDHDEDAPTDFSGFEIDGFKLYRKSQDWPAGPRVIRVAYNHGYAEGSGPAEVTTVALEAIRALWRTRAAQGLQSASIGPMSVTFQTLVASGVSPDLLNSVKRSLF